MVFYDNLLVDDFEGTVPGGLITDAKTLERLTERSYVRDWSRLGLGTHSSNNKNKEPFRITTVNSAYMMCRRYIEL